MLSSATGAALNCPSRPPSSQRSFPVAGSCADTLLPPHTTSSVRLALCHTNGVLQDDLALRLTRQSSFPVFLSKATRKDLVSLSHCRNKRSPSSTGELPVPQPRFMGYEPRSLFHTSLPARS